jgi:hypothetical protein
VTEKITTATGLHTAMPHIHLTATIITALRRIIPLLQQQQQQQLEEAQSPE